MEVERDRVAGVQSEVVGEHAAVFATQLAYVITDSSVRSPVTSS